MAQAVIRQSAPKQPRQVLIDTTLTGIVEYGRYLYADKRLTVLLNTKERGKCVVYFSGRDGLYFANFLRAGDAVFVEARNTKQGIKVETLYMLGLPEDILERRQEEAKIAYEEQIKGW